MIKSLEKLKQADVSNYRSLPFWSWNDELEEDELVRQIRWMKSQGFGGYFMHARGGLKTEYLKDKWFSCVKACVDEGNNLNMQSWAYDENGWPSGFAGGKLLEEEKNHDKFLTFDIGDFNAESLVSYGIEQDKLIRVNKSGDYENYLNVYEHISPSTADILNPEVVDKFINLTHEKYKKELGENFVGGIKGFFTDEPQYQRWSHPYTDMIKKYFEEQFHEDILNGLGLLFIEKQGYKSFRYKYWDGMQRLMLNGYAKKVYKWCNDNKVSLTGHYVEENTLGWQMLCCAGIMPFYQYETIPGMDWLGRPLGNPSAPKQVSSVAMQLGKKQVLTETFALCGWDVTPKELKTLAEWQYVNGVNLMCQHLLPYSEHGQRKRDYPAHYSWANPWVRYDFKSFNDYFAKLGYLLAESKDFTKVGVFCPVKSVYFNYKRDDFEGSSKDIDDSYLGLLNKLSKAGIGYHILDEVVLEENGKVEKDALIVGKCKYKYVIFPKTYTINDNTKKLLDEFIANGGKVLFTEGVPTHLKWEEYSFGYQSNVTLKDIINDELVKISDYDTAINLTVKEFNGEKFIFAVNTDKDKEYTLTFNGDFTSLTRLNLQDYSTEELSTTVTFKGGESYLMFFNGEKVTEGNKRIAQAVLPPFEVVKHSGNYLILDKLKYSFDGVNYSDKMTYMGAFNQMLEERYEGDLYLKYEFNVKKPPKKIYLLAEDMNTDCTFVNGQAISFNGVSDFDKKTYKSNISDKIKKGLNEVIIKIRYSQSKDVYYALFGENVTESLKNCLSYTTTIEACYLQGDFGVYSKKIKSVEKDVYLAEDDIYISTTPKKVKDLVKNGFMFFAGDITLRKIYKYNGKNGVIKLCGRYALANVTVNGNAVKKDYFGDQVDLTDYLIKGKNVLDITLYSGNRNLMGPHHYKESLEPLAVGPYTYELFGTFKNGKSDKERENYSLVKFGLFKEKL